MSAAAVSELLHAAFRGDQTALGAVLDQHVESGLTINSTDYDKRSALHLAASEGKLVCVKFLVERGADMNVKDRWSHAPLDDAVRQHHSDVVKFLRDSGAKIGDDGEAAKQLFNAVEKSKPDDLKTCIDSGTDVNTADYDMRTPFHVAVAKGNVQVIKMLHSAGANINAVDNFGLTPLGESKRHSMRTGENKIRDLLVELGAKNPTSDDTTTHKHSKAFVILVACAQLLFVVLFMTCTNRQVDRGQ
jgi:ankyrin repeat protein